MAIKKVKRLGRTLLFLAGSNAIALAASIFFVSFGHELVGLWMIIATTLPTLLLLAFKNQVNQARTHSILVKLNDYTLDQRKRASVKEYQILREVASMNASLETGLSRLEVEIDRLRTIQMLIDSQSEDLNKVSRQHQRTSIEVRTLLDLSLRRHLIREETR